MFNGFCIFAKTYNKLISKKIIDVLSHPVTISLILGSIIILFIPKKFPEFHARLVGSSITSKSKTIVYHDLDNDGNSEEIWFFYFNPDTPSIIVRENGKIIDQWNYKGRFNGYAFYDVNKDGLCEIIFITEYHDSTFLQIISPFYKPNESEIIKDYFVDTYKDYNNQKDHSIYFSKFSDRNHDGISEINFSINAAMTKQPRRFYSFDPAKQLLKRSPNTGITTVEPFAYDINNNGFDEYMFNGGAYDNCKPEDSIPYPDTCCWLLVLDKDLNFLFTPVPVGRYKTKIIVRPLKIENGNLLCVLKIHSGTENIPNELRLYDIDGKLIRKRIIDEFQDATLILQNSEKINKLFILTNEGKIYQIDEQLNLKYITELKKIVVLHPNPFLLDVDQDGNNEIIFRGPEAQSLIVARSDFSNPVKLSTPNPSMKNATISLIMKKDNPPLLFLQAGQNTYTFQYEKNPLYSFQYAVYFGIYLLIFLLVFMLKKIQQARARRKYETEKRIIELQLTSAKNQMSPHFTLNLMQSIATLFDKRDRKQALNVLGKFTKMLRDTLINSDQILVTLGEELEYVSNYLELEKFRFGNKFDFKINISDQVDTEIRIPDRKSVV